MSFVRAYLRASTDQQDATRAKASMDAFAAEKGVKVAAWYIENESGAKLERPELFRLMADAHAGDVLLVEQVDRLSRLNAQDWDTLKAKLAEKRLHVVALDLPTSWLALTADSQECVTQAILKAVNAMLLDVLASVARKDYDDRRRRQAQGIAKAKSEGRFTGRRPDLKRHAVIAEMLAKGMSWSQVCEATGCSRSTVKRVVDDLKVKSK